MLANGRKRALSCLACLPLIQTTIAGSRGLQLHVPLHVGVVWISGKQAKQLSVHVGKWEKEGTECSLVSIKPLITFQRHVSFKLSHARWSWVFDSHYLIHV